MSANINDSGAKPGMIHRISLENFVTYKQVELYPSKNLNVIIGPNGSGKSTFVCAIILGLCGKTSVIGRAKKIGEYVRSGCQRGTIEIELFNAPREPNVIITRTFDIESHSEWYINRKQAREKQIQDIITKFNIQVDNLCQLLPQDRVQDFSKMDPQQLLKSTLMAVGGQDSVRTLEELIEARTEQKQLGTRLNNNTQTLQEQIRLNERLKVSIDAMNERNKIEKEIEICEKKKLWLEYQELRSKVMEYSKDEKEAVKLVAKHRSRIEPLEKVVDKARRNISKMEQEKLVDSRELHSLCERTKTLATESNSYNRNINDVRNDLQSKMNQLASIQHDITTANIKLNKLIVDRRNLTLQDDSETRLELNKLHEQISKTNKAIDKVKMDKYQMQNELDSTIMPQIRLYQNRIRQLEDVASKRLSGLRRYNEDCYQAVMWLRQNKDTVGFIGRVFEPMVLEINFTDSKYAPYLENTVAGRDLMAFTFECTQDMNLFIGKVRNELKLKRVNAVCSTYSNFNTKSPALDNNLRLTETVCLFKKLGFYTYLVDTITAPDTIVKFLCKQYSIHKIIIGNDVTYNNSDHVPANITYFYTTRHRFTKKISAYSKAKLSSVIEIRPSRLMAYSVDQMTMDNYNSELATYERRKCEKQQQMKEQDDKLLSLEQSMNGLLTKRKQFNEGIEKVKILEAQIRVQENKVKSLQAESKIDINKEKAECLVKCQTYIDKQMSCQEKIASNLDTLHRKTNSLKLCQIRLEISRSAIVDQESELRELKNEMSSVQQTQENIKSLLNRAKQSAKTKLDEAKSCCNNKLPQEADFPHRAEFERLPSEYVALQEHCCQLQTRFQCMDSTDEQVIREYEERERNIKRLTGEVNNSSNINKQLESKIQRLKGSWLPGVLELIQSINVKFGIMFTKLGCAGEINLEKSAGEDEYDKYGVSIMVGFRESECLQQLTRHTQSGGERALTTAIYLIALQQLTTVPFRCVDEINQGMDPVNERKMFQLLVAVTTQCDNAQYFLLTPKLLSNLEYVPQIMIHTIMNGRHIINYKQWNIEKFIDKALSYTNLQL